MTNTDAADALWQRLVQWQPATAAALTQHLRALPDDWPLRVFGVGRPDATLTLPPGAVGEQFPDRAPEIAPYDEIAALDDCPACEEAEGMCRFHEGYAAGHHEQTQAQLDAVKARPDIGLREFMHWQADVAEAEDRGQEPPELSAEPAAVPPVDRADEPPLSPYYEHPECGFHWHGRDGMDIPMRDGQPVCPRCELAKVQKQLDYTQRRRDEVGAESLRRGKIKLDQAEKIRALEREIDGVRRQLGAEILRANTAEDELRRMAAEAQPAEQRHGEALCQCGHGKAYHGVEYGTPRCRLCPERGEWKWDHAYTTAAESQPGTEAWDVPDARPGATDHTLTQTPTVLHAIPLPGSNGISSCCGRPPCEFVGERLTRDLDKVTCPGPAAEAQQDGARS